MKASEGFPKEKKYAFLRGYVRMQETAMETESDVTMTEASISDNYRFLRAKKTRNIVQ